MLIIIKFIFHIFLFLSVVEDIKKKIIPEIYIDIMLLMMIFKIIYLSNYFIFYISLSIFILPIFLIMILETYIKIEIIGLGDIKIFTLIGMYFSNDSIYFVYSFYSTLYILSGIIILIFFKTKEKYVAFLPYIYLTFIIYNLIGIIK